MKNLLQRVLGLSLCCLICPNISGQSPDHLDEKSEELKAAVFDGIINLTLLRDSVCKRYTLMMVGENWTIYSEKVQRPPIRIDREYRFQAACKTKSFKYLAHGLVVDPSRSK